MSFIFVCIFVTAACDEEAENSQHANEEKQFLLGHCVVGRCRCNLRCHSLGSDNDLILQLPESPALISFRTVQYNDII